MYTIRELTAAALKIFHTSPVNVRAALELAGKDTFDIDEAKRIVDDFLTHEVKPDGTNLAAGR